MARAKITSGVYMLVKDLDLLLRIAESKGISKRQMAFAAGYRSHGHMYKILDGRTKSMSPKRAMMLANYLGVDLGVIFSPHVSMKIDKTSSRHHVAIY